MWGKCISSFNTIWLNPTMRGTVLGAGDSKMNKTDMVLFVLVLRLEWSFLKKQVTTLTVLFAVWEVYGHIQAMSFSLWVSKYIHKSRRHSCADFSQHCQRERVSFHLVSKKALDSHYPLRPGSLSTFQNEILSLTFYHLN